MNRHSHQDPGTERGASLVEYVLMISLILLVALAGVSAFGETLTGNVNDSASRVVSAQGGNFGP
ncbi:MAG: hypothetical protein R8F63_06245 [Acidimicrobiales bacterium]|nr:hypothetical protein [Acidimicrobiales bacterium]